MTPIKCLELTAKIYEEAEIDREFIISPDGLFFTVQNDVSEEFSRYIGFEVADHMFDHHNFENELKTYLVACDIDLANYYRELAEFYFSEKTNKYFIITECYDNGCDNIVYKYLYKNQPPKESITKTECYEILSISEIPKSHFDVLKKYLEVVN